MSHYHKSSACCGGGVSAVATPSIINVEIDNVSQMIVASPTEPTNPLEGMIWRHTGTFDNYIFTQGQWHQFVSDERISADLPTDPVIINAGAF